MAYQELVTTVWAKNGYWGLYGYDSANGITDGFVAYGGQPEIINYGCDLLVDGIALRFQDAGLAAGNVIIARLRIGVAGLATPWASAQEPFLYLDDWTTAKSPETKLYALNGLLVTMGERNTAAEFFMADVTTALSDKLFVMMWGRFCLPAAQQPQALPVSLEGYKWPLTRR